MTGIAGLELLIKTPGSARVQFSVDDAPHLSGVEYGLDASLSPRVRYVDQQPEQEQVVSTRVLGEYVDGSGAALVWATLPTHSVVITPPGLPASGWRYLAERAGVHMFTSSSALHVANGTDNGCIANVCAGHHVESGGGGLLVHVTNAATSILVKLPRPAVVVDDSGLIMCSPCESLEIGPMQAGDVKLFVLTDPVVRTMD
jgi:hypothetical protein